MFLLLVLAICKSDENSHQVFMRKEINQVVIVSYILGVFTSKQELTTCVRGSRKWHQCEDMAIPVFV